MHMTNLYNVQMQYPTAATYKKKDLFGAYNSRGIRVHHGWEVGIMAAGAAIRQLTCETASIKQKEHTENG